MSVFTIIGLICLGAIAGILSSLVGIGGGIVIVPVLVMAFGLNQHTAQGTTLAILSFPVALVTTKFDASKPVIPPDPIVKS